MRYHVSILSFACLAMASCVPPAPEPTPAPTPTPTPTPTQVAAPAPPSVAIPEPVYENWIDAPVTPGDWFYEAETGETLALFGPSFAESVLMLRCDRTTKRVGIARLGSAAGSVQMRIHTETVTREFTANPLEGPQTLLVAEFAAQDALLDAMAFSRGRIAVEVGGQQTLYVPAWPEITRVIEDCR